MEDEAMEHTTPSRKTDRRTLYTRTVVKDSLLELLKNTTYEKITVTAVCRQAEITRTTFYLHFDDLTDVLDEVLDDALRVAEHGSANPNEDMLKMLDLITSGTAPEQFHTFDTLLPACQRVADHPKYRPLFQDDSLSSYIIGRIYLAEKEKMLPLLMEHCRLSLKEADKVYMLVIYGAFYVNKSMNWKKDEQWYRLQSTLAKFILGGFNALKP